jgi:phage terminase large subunit GpA-like protein
MAKCDSCGNDYDKAFELRMSGKTYTFDSFECAIQTVAPRCEHCNVPIIGHGLEKSGRMFCCDHCATEENVTELRDRAD